jgi:5,10-methylenetetrahydromethanopterin reductase
VQHRGEVWSLTADGPMPRPTDQAPKVMLAALGDQMLRIAGTRTDGTILWCVGPRTDRDPHRAAHQRGGRRRRPPAPSIVCSIPCWVTDDPGPAREFIGKILANYADAAVVPGDARHRGHPRPRGPVLRRQRAEVRDGIASVADAGATDFTAVVMGGNPDEIAATRALLASAAAEG